MDLLQQLPAKYSNTLNLSYKNIISIGIMKQGAKIEHLHLSYNQITKLDNIEQFKFLKSLSLANNKITSIQELQKVSKTLQYLTLNNNPLEEYDYWDICFQYFPKLKRIDGIAVDQQFISKQRNIVQNISRWLIPFYYEIDQLINSIEKAIQLRQLNEELQPSQRLLIDQDCVLNIDWSRVEQLISFRNNDKTNLQYLKQIVHPITLLQQLEPEQCKQMKRIHYEAFKQLIKQLSIQNYTTFIDYLISKGDDPYKSFISLQKPQLHIGQDLYIVKSECLSQEEPQKIHQQVPLFLRGKIKDPHVISNTYTKPKQQQHFEQQEFYQYFPIFPFRVEYTQSIVQITLQKINQLHNLMQQISSMYSSKPQTVRTQRRKPKLNKVNPQDPTPIRLVPQPTEQEEQINELPKQQSYNEIKHKILMENYIKNLMKVLQSIINKRLNRTLQRINDPTLENTLNIDYPEMHYLRCIFNSFKTVFIQNRKTRQKIQQKKLIAKCFYGLKQLKYINLHNKLNKIKSISLIKQLYIKQLIQAFKQIKQWGNDNQQQQIIEEPKYILKLEDAPRKTQPFEITIKQKRNYSYSLSRLCSVCNY